MSATTERKLAIEGMTCHNCANHVERALKKVSGVTGATVDLAANQATVQYDPDAVNIEDLSEAVARAGYAVRA